jgi:hypothetical protein
MCAFFVCQKQGSKLVQGDKNEQNVDTGAVKWYTDCVKNCISREWRNYNEEKTFVGGAGGVYAVRLGGGAA